MNCVTCGKEIFSPKKKYCSPGCKNSFTNNKHQNYLAQQNRARLRREILINLLGGKCFHCGYSLHPAALAFHHVCGEKRFNIDARKCSNAKFDTLVAEAEKCILLCHNCHAIEHCSY